MSYTPRFEQADWPVCYNHGTKADKRRRSCERGSLAASDSRRLPDYDSNDDCDHENNYDDYGDGGADADLELRKGGREKRKRHG